MLAAQLSPGGGDGHPGRIYLPPDAMHAERISAGQLLAVSLLSLWLTDQVRGKYQPLKAVCKRAMQV